MATKPTSNTLDVDESNTAARTQIVVESRRDLLKGRREIVHAALRGDILEKEAALHYRGELQNHLLALSQYRELGENSDRFWNGTKDESIGPVYVQPPREVINAARGGSIEPRKVDEISGLNDIITKPNTFSATFTVNEQRVGRASGSEEYTGEGVIGMSVLDEAVRWVSDFERDVGLDLDIPEQIDADGGVF